MALQSEDTFIDILKERRTQSDFAWVTRKWKSEQCVYSKERNSEEIKHQVLNSKEVIAVIKELSIQQSWKEEDVQASAKGIIDEMAHNFRFTIIRLFGFLLSKTFKKIYSSIFVNRKGIEEIREVAHKYPILFLPTHRSYCDFLLVSYICFHFDLPIPIIAAGLDFLGLKIISCLLRGSGAFFIRRSFVSDKLYWAIFAEYVKSLLEGCEHPLEFFIEGTRSRTAKSLVPKLGMLQVLLEAYFSARIPDITIVPISISYDRTLEETLYAYELLGVPKPKESTTGLFKARTILQDFFGNVYVSFGKPVSVKDYCHNYDRSVHNLHPRGSSINTKEEQLLCKYLANYIISMHQKNLLLSPFSIMCLVIGHPFVLKAKGICLDDLKDAINWLSKLIARTGTFVYHGRSSFQDSIEYHLSLHSNIIEVSPKHIVSLRHCDTETLKSSLQSLRLQVNTLGFAIPQMYMYHYGNQAIQIFVDFALVSMAVNDWEKDVELQDLKISDDFYSRYKTLRKLLQREFVFEENITKEAFLHSVQLLKEEGFIANKAELSAKMIHDKLGFFQSLLLHFIEAYHVICQYIASMTDEILFKSLVCQSQVAIETAISDGNLFDYKSLSLDIINNCINFLVSQGALCQTQKDKCCILKPSQPQLLNILLEIEMFLPPAKKQETSAKKTVKSLSKL